MPAQQREVEHPDRATQAVGNGGRRAFHRLPGPAAERTPGVIRERRLDRDHPTCGRSPHRRQGGPAQQSTAPDRHRQHIERRRFGQQFEGRGALPRNHACVVKRMNHVSRAASQQGGERRLARSEPRAAGDDLAPRLADGGQLHGRRIGRGNHDAAQPAQTRRQGERRTVVARRMGRHGGDIRRQLQHRIHGAPELEGAAMLKVLALEEHAATHASIETRRGHDGRPRQMRCQPPRSGHHLREAGQTDPGYLMDVHSESSPR